MKPEKAWIIKIGEKFFTEYISSNKKPLEKMAIELSQTLNKSFYILPVDVMPEGYVKKMETELKRLRKDLRESKVKSSIKTFTENEMNKHTKPFRRKFNK